MVVVAVMGCGGGMIAIVGVFESDWLLRWGWGGWRGGMRCGEGGVVTIKVRAGGGCVGTEPTLLERGRRWWVVDLLPACAGAGCSAGACPPRGL